MTNVRNKLLAAAVAMSACGVAQAVPVFDLGGSQIFYNNFENLYRSTNDCTANTCIAQSNDDPNGFQKVRTSVGNNIKQGDIFAGILDIQNIRSSVTGFDTYNSSAGDRFTGYFAQEVASIATHPGDPTAGHVQLTTATADPFGILGVGEMFRFYSGTPSFTAGGTVLGGINLATAGNFWASLGLATEGYAYTHTDLTAAINDTSTLSFLALDIVNKGAAYNAGLLDKVNEFNESELGGVTAALVCSAAEIANPAIACMDFVATSEIEENTEFALGQSPWTIASNDPARIHRIPEPGTLALLSVAFLGAGFASRRRSA